MANDTIDAEDVDLDAETAQTTVKRRGAAIRSAPTQRKRPSGTTARAAVAPKKQVAARTGGNRTVIVLAGLLALFVAATGFFGFRYFTAPDDSAAAQTQVAQVASDYAVKLSSFDYRDLDKNRQAITAMSTEDFGKKYDEMVKALTEIVSNGKGVATAEVTHAAVESLDGDKATAVLFVNQKARNVVAPDGKSQPYRMVVKLQHHDGRWLVDDVQTV